MAGTGESWYRRLTNPTFKKSAELINRLGDRLLAIAWFMHHLPIGGEGRKSVMVCVQKKPVNKLCDCGCPSSVSRASLTQRLSLEVESFVRGDTDVEEFAKKLSAVASMAARVNVNLLKSTSGKTLHRNALQLLERMPNSVAYTLYKDMAEGSDLLSMEEAWEAVGHAWEAVDECEWKKWKNVGLRAIAKERGDATDLSEDECAAAEIAYDSPCPDQVSDTKSCTKQVLELKAALDAAATSAVIQSDEIESLRNALESAQTAFDKCGNDLSEATTERERIQRELSEETAKLEVLEKDLKDSKAEAEKCSLELERINALAVSDKERLTEELEAARSNSVSQESRFTETKARLETALREKSEAEAANEVELAAIASHLRDIEVANTIAINNKEAELEGVRQAYAAATEEIDRANDRTREIASILSDSETALKEARNRLSTMEENALEDGDALKLCQEQLKQAERNLSEKNAELYEAQRQSGELLQKSEKLKKAITELDDAVAKTRDTYDQECQKLRQSLASSESIRDQNRIEHEEAIALLKKDCSDNASELAVLNQTVEKLESALQEARDESADSTKQLTDAQNKLRQVEARLQEQISLRETCNETISDMRKRLEDVDVRSRKCEDDKADLTGQVTKLEDKVDNVEKSRNAALMRVGTLESQLQNAVEIAKDYEGLVAIAIHEKNEALESKNLATEEVSRLKEQLVQADQSSETERLNAELIRAKEDFVALRNQIDDRLAKDEQREIIVELKDCKDTLAAVEQERDRLILVASHVSVLQGRLDAAEARCVELQKQIDEQKTVSSSTKRQRKRSKTESPTSSPDESTVISANDVSGIESLPDMVSPPDSLRAPEYSPDEVSPPTVSPDTTDADGSKLLDTTHSPHQEDGPRIGPTSSKNVSMLPENIRRDDGSLRAMMLGTACDAKRIENGSEGVPIACARGGKPSDEPCLSPVDAASGYCNLWTIPVPLESPLGGKTKSFDMFRALDPGTQIKMHLHNARVLWTMGANMYIWASPVALDRNMLPYRQSEGDGNSIPTKAIDPVSLGGPVSEYEDLGEAMELARTNKSYGSLAPEYSRLIPADIRESMPLKGKSKYYEARPLWRNGHPDNRAEIQPIRSQIIKSNESIDRAGGYVERAVKHLNNALYIAAYYKPGREAILAGLVGIDGVPNGAMTFLHDNEMTAICWLAQARQRYNEFAQTNTNRLDLSRVRMAIDIELLRYLTETMRTVDLKSWFKFVMENTAVRRSVVAEWRDALLNYMPNRVNADRRLNAFIDEIITEAGQSAARIAQQ